MPQVVIKGGYCPPDIQYYLDGAFSCYDIPPDVYFWAKHFHPNITKVLDDFDRIPENGFVDHGARLVAHGERLERLYLQWQQDAPIEEVSMCLGYGMAWMPSIEQIVGEIANTLVEFRGGVLETIYHRFETHRTDLLVFYNGQKLFQRKRGFVESLYRIEQQWFALEVQPTFADYELVYPERRGVSREEAIAAIREIDEGERLWLEKQKPKAPNKGIKKALKRSAELLNGVTGEKTTELFLSGQEVVVTGQRYKFVLTKEKHTTVTSNHGSARTDVYDIATNAFVAGLCVYTPGVTVFDHLASIVLHCKSGLEEQILLDANVIRRGDDSLLPESKRRKEKSETGGRELGILQNLYGENYLEVDTQRERIRKLNAQLKQKNLRQIIKKYGHIMPARRVELPAMRQLSYAPSEF